MVVVKNDNVQIYYSICHNVPLILCGLMKPFPECWEKYGQLVPGPSPLFDVEGRHFKNHPGEDLGTSTVAHHAGNKLIMCKCMINILHWLLVHWSTLLLHAYICIQIWRLNRQLKRFVHVRSVQSGGELLWIKCNAQSGSSSTKLRFQIFENLCIIFILFFFSCLLPFNCCGYNKNFRRSFLVVCWTSCKR